MKFWWALSQSFIYMSKVMVCAVFERQKTYRETRYSRWSLGDSPCGIMQGFFLSLFLSCLSGSACRRWVTIRLVSHGTKTCPNRLLAAKELKVNMLDVTKYLISVHLSCVSRIEHWQERVFSYLPWCYDACTSVNVISFKLALERMRHWVKSSSSASC